MDASTSYSDSSDVNCNSPPKKMKMRQTTLRFRRVDQTQSSPECRATSCSVSSTADQDLRTSEFASATVCFSDCCKEVLSPYQPTVPCVIKKTRKQQGKKTRVFFLQPDSGDLPGDIQQCYQSDLDLPRLKVQLQMLPNLLRTRNIKSPNSLPIKEVTNIRTLCDLIN